MSHIPQTYLPTMHVLLKAVDFQVDVPQPTGLLRRRAGRRAGRCASRVITVGTHHSDIPAYYYAHAFLLLEPVDFRVAVALSQSSSCPPLSALVVIQDMDCPDLCGFDEEDVRQLERVVERLGQGCEWANLTALQGGASSGERSKR